MLLLGRDLSPFVRRTATTLNILGISYERKIVAAAEDGELIRRFNPLGRIPALVLDNDEVVIDSAAIIDFALELAENSEQILPARGDLRRKVLRLSAMATGAMEKGVTGAYERTQRPPQFLYEPYRQKVLDQALAGLAEISSATPKSGYIGGALPNLADINAVVAYDFINIVAPDAVGVASLGALENLSERANALEAFASTRWQP